MEVSTHLIQKAASLPKSSGCYLMKDVMGKVLYVGKAKNLCARVGSYFQQKGSGDPKTKTLVQKISDFDFILTENDAEAFVLENNLIKEYAPRYNVRLRDDKTYPYIIVDTHEPFPTLKYVRRPQKKSGRLIYGPFPVGSHVWEVVRTIVKSFNLRDCSLEEFLRRKNPCILYQMRQCSAPCVGMIGIDDYQKDLKGAVDILKGRGKESLAQLRAKMSSFADFEKFEQAAIIRDHLSQLENFIETSMQNSAEFLDKREHVDVIAYQLDEGEIDIVIYFIREGILLGNKSFHFPWSAENPRIDALNMGNHPDEVVLTQLLQYYGRLTSPMPDLIILPVAKELLDTAAEALNAVVRVHESEDVPQRKRIAVAISKRRYQRVLELAQRAALESKRMRREQKVSADEALTQLQEILHLKDRPRLIECYDIAIWQGKSPTAAQVVFQDGRMLKELYRHYHLEERPEGNNDFAMMEEVLKRRLAHDGHPDVLLIDGGKGQVGMVQRVLEDMGIIIPVIGIIKPGISKQEGNPGGSEGEKKEERLYVPGRKDPLILSKRPALWRLLARMRNEAHRFSRRLHHTTELKRVITGTGVGSKRGKGRIKGTEDSV